MHNINFRVEVDRKTLTKAPPNAVMSYFELNDGKNRITHMGGPIQTLDGSNLIVRIDEVYTELEFRRQKYTNTLVDQVAQWLKFFENADNVKIKEIRGRFSANNKDYWNAGFLLLQRFSNQLFRKPIIELVDQKTKKPVKTIRFTLAKNVLFSAKDKMP